MLLALGMIAFAVMFGGGTMGFRSVLMMLGGLVVFVFSHWFASLVVVCFQ